MTSKPIHQPKVTKHEKRRRHIHKQHVCVYEQDVLVQTPMFLRTAQLTFQAILQLQYSTQVILLSFTETCKLDY